jgi:hypothetical protein
LNLILSIDEDIVRLAHLRAEALGTSVNQLVSDYLQQLAGMRTPEADATEFERLSREAHGDRRGWKFDRELLHERRSVQSMK